ncbi:PREDICTED: uncharacterized protein LOC105456747 [Wasmannia auropunctata]|uniref:uncharacterized protein LOC105456747 n=1 Tax=Wasmannia auropunctata TaxID=64793 RepID=UPI0005F03769|nr:PREDICTED: uncharacterized protein LOC105456747 [Wasmannia auropunctata]
MPPKKNKRFRNISQHKIDVLAKIICETISDISEINFTRKAEGSICHTIAKKLKKKQNNKDAYFYKRLWDKNVHNFQDIIRNTLEERKNNENGSPSTSTVCPPENVTPPLKDPDIKPENDDDCDASLIIVEKNVLIVTIDSE